MGKILSIIYRSLATTQLRLALETEEERRAKMDWTEIGFLNSRYKPARPVIGTILHILFSFNSKRFFCC